LVPAAARDTHILDQDVTEIADPLSLAIAWSLWVSCSFATTVEAHRGVRVQHIVHVANPDAIYHASRLGSAFARAATAIHAHETIHNGKKKLGFRVVTSWDAIHQTWNFGIPVTAASTLLTRV
jgi:hypothetical protein